MEDKNLIENIKEKEDEQILLNRKEREETQKIINNENSEDEEERKEFDSDIININDKARKAIYICLVAVSCFSSLDGGILPQQVDNIKSDFNTTKDSTVGFFGSVDFIGRVIGAFIFAIIMGKMNRKMLLVSLLLLKSLTLIFALFTKNKIVNITLRGISGIPQVFITTYLTVWCDQYGKEKKRTLMVTFVQLFGALGIVIGYGIGVVCDKISSDDILGWRLAFGFEGIILIVCGLIIFSFKNKYFSCNFVLIKDNEGKEEETNNEINIKSILKNFKKILSNKIYLYTTLSNSTIWFGMSVVQYWGDKYMEKVLHMEKSERFIAFGCLCILGPIVGILVGGIICSKLGGYENKKSMIFLIILIFMGSIISELAAVHTIKILFIILSWFFLFFTCAAIPAETGIIISSLENNLRGDGFALTNCINNLMGNFPASYFFSLVSDLFEKKITDENKNYKHYRYAWCISMGYNFIGLILIIIAGIYRFKIKGDLSKDNLKNLDRESLGKLDESINNANNEQIAS